MKGTMMQFPLTLVERAGKLFRNVEIVSTCRDGSIQHYTYGELYRRAQALAAELQEYGLEPGDRVIGSPPSCVITMLTPRSVPGCCSDPGVLHTFHPAAVPRRTGLEAPLSNWEVGYEAPHDSKSLLSILA